MKYLILLLPLIACAPKTKELTPCHGPLVQVWGVNDLERFTLGESCDGHDNFSGQDFTYKIETNTIVIQINETKKFGFIQNDVCVYQVTELSLDLDCLSGNRSYKR